MGLPIAPSLNGALRQFRLERFEVEFEPNMTDFCVEFAPTHVSQKRAFIRPRRNHLVCSIINTEHSESSSPSEGLRHSVFFR